MRAHDSPRFVVNHIRKGSYVLDRDRCTENGVCAVVAEFDERDHTEDEARARAENRAAAMNRGHERPVGAGDPVSGGGDPR